MDVEWDPGKAASNKRKHGIDFLDAATALYDEHAITIQEQADHDDRFVTIGATESGRIVVVVYRWSKHRPRMISARKATPRERRRYEG